MWPDRRLLDLIKTELPIVLAPMAGAMDAELVIGAAEGGALGSLPCAMLSVEKAREQVNIIRQRVTAPINLNFFCHHAAPTDPAREAAWRKRLAPYYTEFQLDPEAPVTAANRAPFDAAMIGVHVHGHRAKRLFLLDHRYGHGRLWGGPRPVRTG